MNEIIYFVCDESQLAKRTSLVYRTEPLLLTVPLLSVQCNAWYWIDIKSFDCMSVRLSVCLSVRLFCSDKCACCKTKTANITKDIISSQHSDTLAICYTSNYHLL